MLREYRIPYPGLGKHVVYHFSDTHLALWDECSAPSEKASANEQTEAWVRVRAYFQNVYHQPDDGTVFLPVQEQFSRLLAASADGDLAVLTGDLMNEVSGANERFIERQLGAFTKPVVCVAGNHEKADLMSPDTLFGQQASAEAYLTDMGEYAVLALNNGGCTVTDGQLSAAENAFEAGKPVLAVMHIPFRGPHLPPEFKAESSDYFFLDHDGCPAQNNALLRLFTENRQKLIAILAGHLHFPYVDTLAPGLTQYVVSQGIAGHIHRYVIGGA